MKFWDNDEFAHFVLHQEKNRIASWKMLESSIRMTADYHWNLQVRKDASHVLELYVSLSNEQV